MTAIVTDTSAPLTRAEALDQLMELELIPHGWDYDGREKHIEGFLDGTVPLNLARHPDIVAEIVAAVFDHQKAVVALTAEEKRRRHNARQREYYYKSIGRPVPPAQGGD